MNLIILNNSDHYYSYIKYRDHNEAKAIGLVLTHSFDLSIIANGIFEEIIIVPPEWSRSKYHYYYFASLSLKALNSILLVFKIKDVYCFSDLDLVNCLILKKCFIAQKRLHLLESATFPTYMSILSVKSTGRVQYSYLVKKIKLLSFSIFGLYPKDVVIRKFGSTLLYAVNDTYISDINVSHYVPSRREVNIKYAPVLKPKILPLKNQQPSLLLLSERIYDYYIDYEAYIDLLDTLFASYSLEYKKIYFKLHPRETGPLKKSLRNIIEKYDLIMLPQAIPIEKIIDDFAISHAVSFVGGALTDLKSRGILIRFLTTELLDVKFNNTIFEINELVRHLKLNDF